jgi:hydrogenase nickel incorporation protein HypA/HybF
MAQHEARALRAVRLRIGQMSAVVPDALSFCFEIATKGTRMEGADLRMEIVPLSGECHTCKVKFPIVDYAFVCPQCGSVDIEALTGRELSIVEIEVD